MDPMPALSQIAARLRKRYAPPQPRPRSDNPLDSLIQTLLSQNTTAANSARAYANLRRHFPTWEMVHRASLRDLVAVLRPGGLANIKAVWIKALLEDIWDEQGHFNLSFLRDLTDQEVRAYLERFRGIGGKTMACVLLFDLGRPAFPVDTHVFRVCRRLGLLDGARSPEKAQALLEARVPPRDCHTLHVHLVEHGRQTCTARRPDCDACILAVLCDHARRGVPGKMTNLLTGTPQSGR
jgi:endonuclease-3